MKLIAGLLLTISAYSFAGNWDWYLTDANVRYPKNTLAAIEAQGAGTSNLALWQMQVEFFKTHGFDRSLPSISLRYSDKSELGEVVPKTVPVGDAELERLAKYKRTLNEEVYVRQVFSKELSRDAEGIDREEAHLIVMVTVEKAEGGTELKYTINQVRVGSRKIRIRYEGNASSGGGSRR